MNGDRAVPLPQWHNATVVVESPGAGPGYWAGAPSAVVADGAIYLAYRLRRPITEGRGVAAIVARSDDGERFETLVEFDKDDFDAESLERPALVVSPDGMWRLYMSCATPGTLHWRVDVLEAQDLACFDPNRRWTLLPGQETTAVKDPVVVWNNGVWHLWICVHSIGVPAEADRMFTYYATSHDGLEWTWHGVALAGREGTWDARGARITSVLLDQPHPVAYYDGRADAAQNWEEHTGLAIGNGRGRFRAQSDRPAAVSPHEGGGLRYVSVIRLPDGGSRLYYEATRRDSAHDLRTEYVPPSR
jgi:hypothetical protein